MKKNLLTIALALAAVTFSFTPAHAQFGNALKKVTNATKKVEAVTEKPAEVAGTTQGGTSVASEAAVVRKAPPVALLQGDYRDNSRSDFATFIYQMPEDTVKAIKARVEARHAENLTINDRIAQEEIENYEGLMQQCRWQAKTYADIQVENDKVTSLKIDCGLYVTGANEKSKGELAFFTSGGPYGAIVAPMPDDRYMDEINRYSNLIIMLQQEEPKEQYPELQTAQLARYFVYTAQKNSIDLQEKQPLPKDGMNNPALAAEMLRLAQAKFPDMGIVKVIIRDSDWTIDYDAFKKPIRKRIGTYVIKKDGNNYKMTDHSFAQPYAGGKYGATMHYAIGMQNVTVDYK